jgi:hypothetical protein
VAMTDTASGYEGIARILDRNGILLDVGKGWFSVDEDEPRAWSGTLRVFTGSCLEARSLTTLVELDDGSRTLAQVGPKQADLDGDLVALKVVGIDPPPFG